MKYCQDSLRIIWDVMVILNGLRSEGPPTPLQTWSILNEVHTRSCTDELSFGSKVGVRKRQGLSSCVLWIMQCCLSPVGSVSSDSL